MGQRDRLKRSLREHTHGGGGEKKVFVLPHRRRAASRCRRCGRLANKGVHTHERQGVADCRHVRTGSKGGDLGGGTRPPAFRSPQGSKNWREAYCSEELGEKADCYWTGHVRREDTALGDSSGCPVAFATCDSLCRSFLVRVHRLAHPLSTRVFFPFHARTTHQHSHFSPRDCFLATLARVPAETTNITTPMKRLNTA